MAKGLLILLGLAMVVVISGCIHTNYNSYEYDSGCSSGSTLCNGECYSSCSDGYYLGTDCKCHPTEQTLVYDQWNQHLTTLDNDIVKIEEITDRYSDIQTISDANNFIAELNPRYTIYKLHLFEARVFLDTYGQLFSNGAELKRDVDERIVELETSINQLNLAIREYNEALAAQKAQQDAVYTFLRLMVGII